MLMEWDTKTSGLLMQCGRRLGEVNGELVESSLTINLDFFKRQAASTRDVFLRSEVRVQADDAPGIDMFVVPRLGIKKINELSQTERRGIVEGLSFARSWDKLGQPTFQLTGDLAKALFMTRSDTLRGEDIRFPYPTFLVCMIPGQSPVLFTGEDGTRREVTYVYVHHWRAMESKEQVERVGERLKAVCVEYQHGTGKGRDFARALQSITADETMSPQVLIRCMASDGYSMSFRLVPLQDKQPFAVWTKATEKPTAMDGEDPLNRTDVSAGKRLLSLLVNLSLYLTARPEEWLDAPKPRVGKKRKRALVPNKTWVVGRSVKLPRTIARAANIETHMPDSRMWKLQRRFMVRGHWRRVVHGKGRQDRRLQWIAPFWKGPADGGTALLHTFEVATMEERKKEAKHGQLRKDGPRGPIQPRLL